MKAWLRVLVPVVLLALGGGLFWLLWASGPKAAPVVQRQTVPLVRAMVVKKKNVRVRVPSQGTVEPRREIDLVPEVSGKVVGVSASLSDGGFFEEGEVLLRIDPRDYELAITRELAAVAQAEQRLEIEEAEAEVARKEWAQLGRGEKPNPLVLREPQLAQARASLEAAKAMLRDAELNLERTTITAPFAGRVRRRTVDVGQYVAAGTSLGRIYSVDVAEVRLPVPDGEIGFLDVPLRYRDGLDPEPGPEVMLHADFGGRSYQWRGRIVRTDGQIDNRTRQVTLIAEVEDPYARTGDPDHPPLAVGMYVQARIEGRLYENVVVLPRSALREGDRVLVVDDGDRISFRRVSVLRREGDRVLVQDGLEEGERVCLSILDVVTEGMRVEVEERERSSRRRAER